MRRSPRLLVVLLRLLLLFLLPFFSCSFRFILGFRLRDVCCAWTPCWGWRPPGWRRWPQSAPTWWTGTAESDLRGSQPLMTSRMQISQAVTDRGQNSGREGRLSTRQRIPQARSWLDPVSATGDCSLAGHYQLGHDWLQIAPVTGQRPRFSTREGKKIRVKGRFKGDIIHSVLQARTWLATQWYWQQTISGFLKIFGDEK